ncbi:glycosyl hydrolase family 38 [Puteibacter caeruleilacunae]|nr:glycosyl hydrolase family 38 [Puteibacter caeruleilacunae]
MRGKLICFGIVILTMCATFALAGSPLKDGDVILRGFEQKVEGIDFKYHSSVPDVNKAMIVRATTGNMKMTWETQPVPKSLNKKEVVFVWLAGLDANNEHIDMHVEIGNQSKLTFEPSHQKEWTVTNDDDISLTFSSDFTDANKDLFGFMFLRVPAKFLKKGEPLQISITGSKAGSNCWYMTFQEPLEAGIQVAALPAVMGKGKKERQLLSVDLYHFGLPQKGNLLIDNKPYSQEEIHFGRNHFSVQLPTVKKDKDITFAFKSDAYNWTREVTLKPVRHWDVSFIQHSHTDIGYTRSQIEILAEHLRYIDYVLDYCDQTDDLPEEAKFRWTCEASWAVDEFIKTRPAEQIARLKQRVEEGRIEVTGMYFNFDEMPDEQTLASSLSPLKRIKNAGIPVVTAMQNDVNGIAWCFNDYFSQLGVKYLNMGTHGHRALICFDKPTAFWWESPSGNRMLAFRAEHYMTGNTVFGIHSGDFEYFEGKLLRYLEDLESKGYDYSEVAIQHSGFLTDNAPPSTLACEMIEKWNEKYAWPKIRTAVAEQFFRKLEDKYAEKLPVYRAAWPDWWTDGFASGAREVAATRKAHVDVIAGQGGLSMAKILGAKMPEKINDRIDETNKAILFYDEHTFGAAESVRDPYGQGTMEQRALKESYAWEAFRRASLVEEEALGVLQSYVSKEDKPSLMVFNTLNWKRSGLISLFIDHQQVPEDKELELIDASGKSVMAQPIRHWHGGTYWGLWVDDIPALGYKKFLINVKEPQQKKKKTDETVLSNDWYRIKIDKNRGAVTSIVDQQLNEELVDEGAQWKFGEFIYELLDNRSEMEAYYLKNYERFPLDSVWFDGFDEGAVWNTMRFKGTTSAAYPNDPYQFEVRLFNTTKRIDLVYTIRKKPVIEPEGIYTAMPFKLNHGKIFCEVQGGVMEAGVDQLPGSSNDWNTVQNFVAVRNSKAQIVLCSHEAPLMQFGNINTGRYKAGAKPESTHVFGWPMNNYWVTNFNADQRGVYTWSYSITSSSDVSNGMATRFGWGSRIPFLARVLPAGKSKAKSKDEYSLMAGIPENVLLVNATPLEKEQAIILQIREVNGETANLNIVIEGLTVQQQEVDVLGEPLADQQKKTAIKPYEMKFIKISW